MPPAPRSRSDEDASSGGILSDEETRQGLQASIEHWQAHGFGWWIFHHKPDRQFIGRAGLKRYEIDHESVVGLGYAVLSPYWNQGFATEMAEACLRLGFGPLSFTEITTWALPHNTASLRVMQKLGFRYERDITFAGLVHRYFRLSASDWRNQRD